MIGPARVLWRVFVGGLVLGYVALCVVTIVTTGETWTLLGWGGFAFVGGFVLSTRPGNAIGWLLLAIGLYWGSFGLFLDPGFAPTVPVAVELAVECLGTLLKVLLPLLVLVFPTGRVETRLGRGIAVVLAGFGVLLLVCALTDPSPLPSGRSSPLAFAPIGPTAGLVLGDTGSVVVPVFFVAVLVDLVLRWRRSDGARRLQFRWLVFGVAATTAVYAIVFVTPSPSTAVTAVFAVGLNAIPVSIGIAVTRHGLYEIGRVVSRTVSYAIVTAFAVGVYALVVTSLTLLLPGAPAVGVALATLAAAALFLPLLRSVQRWVDRRFDRERYNTEKVVDAFGERLRTGADPSTTAPALIAAVEQTLQPASVGIWTLEDAR